MSGAEIHPRRTSDPCTVLWVGVELGGTGRLVSAPGELGQWLADGRITTARAERQGLWITLPQPDWSTVGDQVRQLLVDLPPTGEVEIVDDPELLGLVAEDVIGSSLGDYIASHGGVIEILEVTSDEVRLDMSGACAHCPAATITLHGRIEGELRRRMGDQVRVRAGAEHESLWQRFRSRGRG